MPDVNPSDDVSSPAGGGRDSSKIVLDSMNQINKILLDNIVAIRKLAKEGPSILLPSIGGALVVISLVIRVASSLSIMGEHLNFTSIDFGLTLLFGTILLLAGSGIRVYSYTNAISLERTLLEMAAARESYAAQREQKAVENADAQTRKSRGTPQPKI